MGRITPIESQFLDESQREINFNQDVNLPRGNSNHSNQQNKEI
jgi:hypothetical protein